VYHHYYSYDMNIRPTILFGDPPMVNPVEELPAATFVQLTGFWPGQFEEIVGNLLLLPDIIVCPVTQSTSSKQLAIFLLLRRWNKADTWDDVSHALRHGRVWCIKIYRAVYRFSTLIMIHCNQ
jgi:hypothetical protein